MPIDASIPLQAQSQPFTLNNVAQIMQMRQQAVEQRQANAQNNALMSIYNDPSSLGKNGMPTDEAIRKISGVSPQLGMKMRMDDATIAEKTALAAKNKSQAYVDSQKAINDAMNPLAQMYEADLAKGVNPDQATKNIQQAYSESNDALIKSGVIADEDKGKIPRTFNYARVKAGLQSYSDMLKGKETEKKDDRADASAALAEKRFENTEKNEDRRYALSEHNSARADRNSANIASALQGLTPEAISDSADKLRNGMPIGLPMRGGAAAKAAVEIANTAARQARGDYSVATNAAQDARQGKAETTGEIASVKAFSTGKQGDTVRSINVAMSHLDTLREAAAALKNGDTPMFNRLAQTISQQTGHPAPTTFDGIKQIVGDELVKGVVGSGGGQGDREEMAKTISRVNSPGQFEAIFDNYQSLLGGQLGGLKRQYKTSTKRSDFDTHLSERSKSLMPKEESDSGLPRATNPKTGHTVVYKNGAWVDE